MNNSGKTSSWGKFCDKVRPGFETTGRVFKKIENVITAICSWIFKLRKILMAIPVLYWALKLASENRDRLPALVGLNLQSSGEFAQLVSRDYAVYGPLGVTVFCLILMFCSRKALFPWLVSIFSLVLPYLIWITNIYPA